MTIETSIEVFDINRIWAHPLIAEFAVKIGPTKIYGYKISHYISTERFYILPPSIRVDGEYRSVVRWENNTIAKAIEDRILEEFGEEFGLALDPISMVMAWWQNGRTLRFEDDIWNRGRWHRMPYQKRKQTSPGAYEACQTLVHQVMEEQAEAKRAKDKSTGNS